MITVTRHVVFTRGRGGRKRIVDSPTLSPGRGSPG